MKIHYKSTLLDRSIFIDCCKNVLLIVKMSIELVVDSNYWLEFFVENGVANVKSEDEPVHHDLWNNREYTDSPSLKLIKEESLQQ